MSNINRPAGLAPVQYLNGSPWSGQARMYCIPQTDTNSYAIGDPVALNSNVADGNGVPAVKLASAGAPATNPLLGAIVGVARYESGVPNPSNLDSIVIPAAKLFAWYVMVVDDPHVIYAIQEAGANTIPQGTGAGGSANLLAGPNNGFLSGWQLDNTTFSASPSAGQLQLLGLQRTPDNGYGQYAKWLARINGAQL